MPALVRTDNELERTLADGSRTDVLAALADSDVYVRVRKAGGDVSLGTIERDSESYVAVFSSLARMAEFDPAGGDYARLNGRGLGAATPAGLRAVINPGAELGIVLDADELAGLADAPRPPDPWFLVGEPAEEPEALIEAIAGFARDEPSVRTAYRGLILRRGAPRPELVIALELGENAETRSVLERAARAAGDDEPSFLVLGDDEVSRVLVARTEPFYRA